MTMTSRTEFHHLVIFEIDKVSQQATTNYTCENKMFEHDRYMIRKNE